MVLNRLTSMLPGDGRRRYLQVNAAVNPEALERLRSLVQQGKLRVPIDSCWDFKDALQVRLIERASEQDSCCGYNWS